MRVAECKACGTLSFPPHRVCSNCGKSAFAEKELDEGVVVTYTVLHVPPPDLTPPVPIAIVEFDGGVRALGQVTEPVDVGSRVVPEWAILREVGGTVYEGFRFRPLEPGVD